MTNPIKTAWCPHCDAPVKAEIVKRRMMRGESYYVYSARSVRRLGKSLTMEETSRCLTGI